MPAVVSETTAMDRTISFLSDAADRNIDDSNLDTLACLLADIRRYRRNLADIEHHIETEVASLMDADQVNLGDNLTLIRHTGSERKGWRSEEILRSLGMQARMDEHGEVQPPNEQYTRLYELVQACVPLNASLGWRVRALRERRIDPDQYADVKPGLVSVEVQVSQRAGALRDQEVAES
jgi:hypothetical protein